MLFRSLSVPLTMSSSSSSDPGPSSVEPPPTFSSSSPLAQHTNPSLLTPTPCPSSGAGGAQRQEARPSPLHRCHLPTAPHAASPEPCLPGTRLVWRRQTHRELKTHHRTEAGRGRFIWREEGAGGPSSHVCPSRRASFWGRGETPAPLQSLLPVQAVNGLGTVRPAPCCQVLRWSIC